MERLNGVSSEKVKDATGRDWAEWISFLDSKNATELDHRAIVDLVHAEINRNWWSQMVTVGYEQAKGKRVPNQNAEGFQINVSKTYDAPLAKVYKAWDEFLDQWYNGPVFTITTNNKDKNIRGRYEDGSLLAMGLYGTKTGKTQVALDVNKLTSATKAEAMRSVWKQQLEQLSDFLS